MFFPYFIIIKPISEKRKIIEKSIPKKEYVQLLSRATTIKNRIAITDDKNKNRNIEFINIKGLTKLFSQEKIFVQSQ